HTDTLTHTRPHTHRDMLTHTHTHTHTHRERDQHTPLFAAGSHCTLLINTRWVRGMLRPRRLLQVSPGLVTHCSGRPGICDRMCVHACTCVLCLFESVVCACVSVSMCASSVCV